MCLSPDTIILYNKKAIKKHIGLFCVLNWDEIENLYDYVEMTSAYYGFDEIESICLAAYQIVKNHFFFRRKQTNRCLCFG